MRASLSLLLAKKVAIVWKERAVCAFLFTIDREAALRCLSDRLPHNSLFDAVKNGKSRMEGR